jgi:hypothetical protein
MELWLLGGGAVVLIALTLWIVWPAEYVETTGDDFRNEEDLLMTPQGDEFEDQYTSATADLSAGGVATAIDAMQEEEAGAARPSEPPTNAEPTPYGAAGESWSSPTIAREGATDVAVTPASSSMGSQGATDVAVTATSPGAWSEQQGAWSEPQAGRRLAQPRTIGIGAAIVLAIASAAFGAWLYARWQRRRNAPINRVRRGLRESQKELSSRLHDAQQDLGSSLRHSQKDLRSSLRHSQKELRSSRFADAVRG